MSLILFILTARDGMIFCGANFSIHTGLKNKHVQNPWYVIVILIDFNWQKIHIKPVTIFFF